jgi:hydrogenase/urease accessory protein HupE
LCATTGVASAHDLGFSRTVVALLADGSFRIDLQADLDALALAVSQDTDNAQLMAALDAMSEEEIEESLADLRQTFLRRVRLRFDGETFLPEITFPDARSDRARAQETVFGLTARLSGDLPAGATDLTLQASRAFPPLHITFIDVRTRNVSAARLDELLEAGAATTNTSEPSDIATLLGDLVVGRQILEQGARSDSFRLDRPPLPPSRFAVATQYAQLGFTHIIPRGLDHILFVLGLFLLNSAWRPLLAQVTAFTAAHTLTLALSTYGVVSLPASIVEPLIAVSIAWIAFENVATDELKWWRPAVVFAFGLLHGLGFAGVLSELGLPRDEYVTALLSFNVGVEVGQLAVIALAALALGTFRNRSWYRSRVTVPLSTLIGFVGIYWAIERIIGG